MSFKKQIYKASFYSSILLGSVISSTVYASETVNYNIHQQYVTPRSLGAGGSFSGIDDHHALFFNPASLAHRAEKDFNIGIAAGTSQDTMDFTKDVKDISDNDALSDPQKIDAMSDFLELNYGKVFSGRLPKLEFLYARPRWSWAFIPADLSLAVLPNKLAGPAIDVTAYQDTTLALAYGRTNRKKNFSWGITAKTIYRAAVDKSLLAVDLVNDSDIVRDSDFQEGLTVDADIGVMYTPWKKDHKIAKYAHPTFQMVVRNAVDAGFFSNFEVYNDGTSKPADLQRRLDVGTLIELPDLKLFKPRLMIDVRDILHDYFSIRKGLRLGTEWIYYAGRGLHGSLQGGYGQGYWTAGLGIQTFFFKLELVSYAEDYGTKSEKKTDRQYLAQINFNF